MADDTGNCHLIEINASPSLERSFVLDEIIKQSLVDDIIDLVNSVKFNEEALCDVLNERL